MTLSPRSAFSILLFVSFVWGAEFVLIDMTIDMLPVNTFNGIRFFIAAFALLPLYFYSSERHQKKEWKTLFPAGLLLGSLLAIAFYTQTEGMLYTTVSNAGFITGLAVPLVSVLGFLIFKNKTKAASWVGIATATSGLYLLTMGESMEFNKGDFLVLICAFGFAFHIVLTGRFVEKMPVITLSIIQLFAVGIYSISAAVLSADPVFYYPDADVVSWSEQLFKPIIMITILIAALFGTALAFGAQTAAQKELPAHKVALIFATEPVFAAISAWLFLDERLGWIGFMGAGFILAGMLISELGDKDHPPKVNPLDQNASP